MEPKSRSLVVVTTYSVSKLDDFITEELELYMFKLDYCDQILSLCRTADKGR
jgi:hypothetical protein